MVSAGADAAGWRAAWAKAPRPEPDERALWLPLHVHLTDSGSVARLIWDEWAGEGVRSAIASDTDGDEGAAREIVALAAGLHDVGKLTRAFAGQVPEMRREMETRGFRWEKGSIPEDSRSVPHALAGYVLLVRHLAAKGVPRQNAEAFAVIVGGHHGVPPNGSEIRTASAADRFLGAQEWEEARAGLFTHVVETLNLTLAIEALDKVRISDASQLLITAVVIMADWIASNADLFPLVPRFDDVVDGPAERAHRGWHLLGLPRPWRPTAEAMTAEPTQLLRSRFGVSYEANQVQHLTLNAARAMPEAGLLLIEAVMGAGKTEASLLAAEVLAQRFGRAGVFYGLPTRATADAMFHRLLTWWENLPDADEHASAARGVALRHSSASLNDEYRALPRRASRVGAPSRERAAESGDGPMSRGRLVDVGRDVPPSPSLDGRRQSAEVIAHHWTSGRKQASFADTVVATIDHQLLAALSSRHVVLRHLGLARQVVVLDEVHSADTWMEVYLERALEWLARYGVPVVVLSATLAPDRRRGLVEAYERGRRASRVMPAPSVATVHAGAQSVLEPSLPTPTAPARRASVLSPTRPVRVPMPVVPDSDAYPLVTTLSAGEVRQVSAEPPATREVEVGWLADDPDALIAALDPVVSAGGCALVVCNTVSRAVRRYRELGAVWGEGVSLAHSRFIAHDRIRNDTWLRETFGPGSGVDRAGRVVVATQVAEQSLDIDFDLLVTDLAPVDLVLQRIGRLHRHPRGERPGAGRTARCLVTAMNELPSPDAPPGLDRGGATVYSAHLLLRSAALLDDLVTAARPLLLPDDVPSVVRACYGRADLGPQSWQAVMAAARADFDEAAARIAKNAEVSCLRSPGAEDLVVGLLEANVGEAESSTGITRQVRQDDGGFEVILVEDAEDGIRLLPHLDDGRALPTQERPDAQTVRLLARSMVRVPGWVTTYPSDTERVLRELSERYYPGWQKAPVLAGQLVLAVDPGGNGHMGPFTVRYDAEIGLEVARA